MLKVLKTRAPYAVLQPEPHTSVASAIMLPAPPLSQYIALGRDVTSRAHVPGMPSPKTTNVTPLRSPLPEPSGAVSGPVTSGERSSGCCGFMLVSLGAGCCSSVGRLGGLSTHHYRQYAFQLRQHVSTIQLCAFQIPTDGHCNDGGQVLKAVEAGMMQLQPLTRSCFCRGFCSRT